MKRRAILGALVVALPLCAAAATPADPGAAAVREKVRSYRVAHEAEILDELAGLLVLPNLASDRPNIERNAAAIVAALERRGVGAELWRVPDAPPVVYGELDLPGATRTVILYAHYDGQPVVASQWTGEPWKPVLRDKPLEEGGREIPRESARAPINPEYTIVRETPDLETRGKTPRLVRLRWDSGYPAARTPMDLPVSRAVARVIEDAAGSPIVQLPTLGGSIPMYLFVGKLKTPTVGIPIVNHDNNQHAANENLRLQNLWDGIEIRAALLTRLGHVWR